MDLPRIFTIRESSHRVHNPLTAAQLATLGGALHLKPGTTVLDLACGSGELLCTWARDHQIVGTGVDLSSVFINGAQARAKELAVQDRVSFIQSDASGYFASDPVDIAACVGASWIGGGVAGVVGLLEQSLLPGGLMLVGEPYWRQQPTSQKIIEECEATSIDDFKSLPGLIEQFSELGYDIVEMVLSSQESWDRYQAAQWLNLRRWLDVNPYDELAETVRAELSSSPVSYVQYTREYVGWGVFVLIKR